MKRGSRQAERLREYARSRKKHWQKGISQIDPRIFPQLLSIPGWLTPRELAGLLDQNPRVLYWIRQRIQPIKHLLSDFDPTEIHPLSEDNSVPVENSEMQRRQTGGMLPWAPVGNYRRRWYWPEMDSDLTRSSFLLAKRILAFTGQTKFTGSNRIKYDCRAQHHPPGSNKRLSVICLPDGRVLFRCSCCGFTLEALPYLHLVTGKSLEESASLLRDLSYQMDPISEKEMERQKLNLFIHRAFQPGRQMYRGMVEAKEIKGAFGDWAVLFHSEISKALGVDKIYHRGHYYLARIMRDIYWAPLRLEIYTKLYKPIFYHPLAREDENTVRISAPSWSLYTDLYREMIFCGNDEVASIVEAYFGSHPRSSRYLTSIVSVRPGAGPLRDPLFNRALIILLENETNHHLNCLDNLSYRQLVYKQYSNREELKTKLADITPLDKLFS